MKVKSRETPRIVSYIYIIAIARLVLWILLISRNSFWNTYQLKRKVEGLESEAEYLRAVNDSLARENARLKTDPEAAEKSSAGAIWPHKTG